MKFNNINLSSIKGGHYKMRNIYGLLFLFIIISLIGCNQIDDTNKIDESLFSETDYESLTVPNNQLAFKLLEHVEPNEANNVFISPTSLFMALSMVYNGAEGEAKKEIAQALQIDKMSKDELNRANASLLSMLMKQSDEIELSIANSIWLNGRFQFKDEFIQHNEQYFNAEISEIDVLDNNSVKLINDWVSKQTKEKITEIVEPPLNPDLVTMLINALYFKGNWTYEFDESLTEDSEFTNSENQTSTIPLMMLNEKLAYIENNVFQAVSLPYGDGEMSMDIYLPRENVTLEELTDELIGGRWEDWNRQFEEEEGTVLLPKFELEYEAKLNDPLKQLGMDTVFTEEAELPNIIVEDERVWISNVRQKTYIDVHEKGTEAAAVTVVEVETMSANIDEPFYMEINRPFFFMIKDVETNMILFTGLIENPL